MHAYLRSKFRLNMNLRSEHKNALSSTNKAQGGKLPDNLVRDLKNRWEPAVPGSYRSARRFTSRNGKVSPTTPGK